MPALLHIGKVPSTERDAFEASVKWTAEQLKVNPDWLMQIMYFESGLRPWAQNTKYLVQGEPATGLIQFVKSTAEALGTTTAALKGMGYVQQMNYVYKYFRPYAGRMKSVYDVYLVTFYPAALGRERHEAIGGKAVSNSNPAFDLNKNGIVTVGEFQDWIAKRLPQGNTQWVGWKKWKFPFFFLIMALAAITFFYGKKL
jgi:hypothetical protein